MMHKLWSVSDELTLDVIEAVNGTNCAFPLDPYRTMTIHRPHLPTVVANLLAREAAIVTRHQDAIRKELRVSRLEDWTRGMMEKRLAADRLLQSPKGVREEVQAAIDSGDDVEVSDSDHPMYRSKTRGE